MREQVLAALSTPLDQYGTVLEALAKIADAREFQKGAWPAIVNNDANGRSLEEWILLMQAYQTKLVQVYAESNGSTAEGRARVLKYAAISANLSLWAVQAALSPNPVPSDSLKDTVTGSMEIVDASGGAVGVGVTVGLPYKNAPGDLDHTFIPA